MHRRLISLISLSSLVTMQVLPCPAQSVSSTIKAFETIPPHTWTPPAIPTYQHTWQSSSTSSGSHLTPHHWNNTNSSNNGANSSRHNNSSTNWSTHNNVSPTPPVNLDLSSTNQSVTAPHILQNGTAIINVGGTSLTINSSSLLTPAERLTVQQVLTTGQQSLVLDAQGSADGGTLVINSHLSQHLSNLVIPQGVTVIDISKSGTSNLTGSITDDGSLYVTSFNPTVSTINVRANNITVQSQGLISDVIPAGTLSFCCSGDAKVAEHVTRFAMHRPWVNNTNTNSNLSLSLNAANNITNTGTISSGGSLNLTAGGSITNTGAISSINTLSLNTGGSITNAGLIQSLAGNINATVAFTVAGQTINIESTGGTWQALNGNINIGFDSNLNDNANGSLSLNLTGGNFLSQQLNIDLGCGALVAGVQNVTGVVNVNAGDARLLSTTPDLQIGTWNISGDPTIIDDNTITLTNNITTDGAPLTIISGQNIISNTAITINTSSSSASGGNVNIIAGASFTPDPYTSGTVTILGPSTTGGSINLTLNSGANNGINTQSTSTGDGGGNVVLAAFAGTTTNSGQITLSSSSTIATGGSGNGSPGHVFVIAGANTASASNMGISIGNINTVSSSESGGPGPGSGLAGGHIVLATEQPYASDSNPWTIDPSTGNSLVGGALGGSIADAPISVTSITTGGGQLIVFSGLGITVGSVSTIGTNVISTAPASSSTFPGGMVTLIANAFDSTTINTDIVIDGNIVTSGPSSASTGTPLSGSVVAMTTGNVSIGNITTNNESTATGATGGSIYIVAGGSNSQGNISVGTIDTDSSHSQAGTVDLASMGTSGSGAGTISITSINTSSANSSGAPITISSPGPITVTGAINSQGGNGNGGSLFVASGLGINSTSGLAISVAAASTINTSGTATSGGVYLLAGSSSDTITSGTITPVTIEVISAYNPTLTSITGHAGTIVITLGTSSGASTLSKYVPGGYLQLNDQSGSSGGVTIDLAIANGDPNVNVPLVSLNSALTLQGAAGSQSSIQSTISNGTVAGYSLLSPDGVTVGGSNATLTTFSGSNIYLGMVASSSGTVSLNNSSGSTTKQITTNLAASSSGALSISTAGALSISSALSAFASSSITLAAGTGVDGGLTISGSISAASTVTLSEVGSGSVSVSQNVPSVIGASTLDLTNVTTPGTIYPDVAYLNVNALTSSTISIDNANNVSLTVPQSGTFTLTSGGQITLANTTSSSLNATTSFSLTASGDIVSATSGSVAIVSPSISLTSSSGNIGSGSNLLEFSSPSGTETLSVTSDSGSTYLQSTNETNITLTAASVATDFTLLSAGSIDITGNVTASGTNGGSINITSPGITTIESGVFVEANGTTGSGGLIQFASSSTYGNLNVLNNGTIEATNNAQTSGIVGFNGGSSGSITLSGNGTAYGGEYVGFGNLNATTLAVYNAVALPTTNSFIYGNIIVSQSSILNVIEVTRISSSSSTTASSYSPLNFLVLAALLQQGYQQQLNSLNEQIGTRIAIDYTPWITPPGLLLQSPQFPLQGNVTIEQIAGASEGLFAASSFNANELNALANQGIVFGSTSNGYFFDLVKGFVLFMPTSNITVQTREGLVFIPKGAIVWIMETGSDAAIYDLHDSLHTGVVKVTANNKELALSPGTEILLTRNGTASFDSLNPGNTISYRNVKSSNIGDGIKAFVCDFSIEHGLTHIPIIHNLLKSNDPAQRKAAWKMIKDATILADLTSDASPYKTKP